MTANIIKLVEQSSEPNLDEAAPAFSEEAIALHFAQRYEHELRYVAAWPRWLEWDGKRWKVDDKRAVYTLARKICRSVALLSGARGIQIASAKTRSAVVGLAGEDPRLVGVTDQWDADPWLLNTPDGVLDLKTGLVRPHCPEDYMTKITAVGAGGESPLWNQFLARVTDGSIELEKFLQRICGYALTGLTIEHALFFLHGLGANGKSVFISTIAGILGDYHRTAPIETFTASAVDRHPTELAMLRGARLVTATETDEGRAWAESRIKALTGGDRVSARFMRQDFFEFLPQFKLVIAGNHRPSLKSTDEAIKRRMNMIPFSVTIPDNERDPELSDKLKAEWPGILNWMVAGCLDWQRGGLACPDIVTGATREYLEGEDAHRTWMDECCRLGRDEWTSVGNLFASWKMWAEASGEHVGDKRRFSQKLGAAGFRSVRRDNRGFSGLTIYRPTGSAREIKSPIWTKAM